MDTITNAVLTAYCACKLCCGPAAPQPTASGVMPVQGITIAAPRIIPLGTRVKVQGMTNIFIVHDRTARKHDNGMRGNWDIFLVSHKAAREFGKQRRNITIISYGKNARRKD